MSQAPERTAMHLYVSLLETFQFPPEQTGLLKTVGTHHPHNTKALQTELWFRNPKIQRR
jgi:hypothetical protein